MSNRWASCTFTTGDIRIANRAATLPEFVPADGLFEWVESPEGKREVRQRGKTQTRPDKGQPDVTFRVAKDI